MTRPDVDPAALIEAAQGERQRSLSNRARIALGVSGAVTVTWVAVVVVTGQVDRVIDNWAAALTMLFGSFVAGSTPQGGGAVAFPVLTKVMGSPPELARTMGLSIQTFGMGIATVATLINRRAVSLRAFGWTTGPAICSFVATAALGSRWDTPFAASRLDGTWTRIIFTVLIVSMGFAVARRARQPLVVYALDVSTSMSTRGVLIGAGLAGGALSALAGSGADLMMFLACSVILGLEPRRAVATSVMVMSSLSLIGFAWFGVIGGQLDVTVDAQHVVAVDERPVAVVDGNIEFFPEPGSDASAPSTEAHAADADRYDLSGMVLAAVPVVVWGAPLGAWFASRASAAVLAAFIASLAVIEYVSTLILVPEIWSNAALGVTALGGVIVLSVAIDRAQRWGERVRHDDGEGPRFRRATVDTSPGRLNRLGNPKGPTR